jgi:hypothetical protein
MSRIYLRVSVAEPSIVVRRRCQDSLPCATMTVAISLRLRRKNRSCKLVNTDSDKLSLRIINKA